MITIDWLRDNDNDNQCGSNDWHGVKDFFFNNCHIIKNK